MLLAAAAERAVTFVAGSDFMLEGGTNALRLAYSAVTPEQATEGTRRLGEALESIKPGRRPIRGLRKAPRGSKARRRRPVWRRRPLCGRRISADYLR